MSAFTLLFARNQSWLRKFFSGLAAPFGRFARKHSRKTKSRQPLIAERKALRRHRGPRLEADQRSLFSPLPRSCIRIHSQENVLKRTKIALALPSYDRQRLSGIRRGWCPSQSERIWVQKDLKGVPFRRWRRSPPVVKWGSSIIRRVLSQAKRQQQKYAGNAYGICGIARSPESSDS